MVRAAAPRAVQVSALARVAVPRAPAQGRGRVAERGGAGGGTGPAPKPQGAAKKTTFFGTVKIDPIKAKLQFSDVAEEVLLLFTQKPGVKVRVSLEIEAEAPGGFDDSVQRSVRENCNQLKFKNHEFGE